MDLSRIGRRVLRVVAGSVVSHAVVEHAIGPECDVSAIVDNRGGESRYDALIVAAGVIGIGEAADFMAVIGGRGADVNIAVLLVLGVKRESQESFFATRIDGRVAKGAGSSVPFSMILIWPERWL